MIKKACNNCRKGKHENCWTAYCHCCGLGKIYQAKGKTKKVKRLIIHQQSVLARLRNLERKLDGE